MSKQRGLPVNGMLLLDKPPGLSSNRALQHAKRLLNARKAGHTGSLDPIATGLLPLCFGETTKISGLFLEAGKSYCVQIRLGADTDTGDREGKVVQQRPVDFNEQQLHDALDQFRGDFEQIPPMFSALKKNGQPLYKLARAGISIERAPRPVTVYALSLEKWCDDLLELNLSCSRGFYVRTLAADLGEVLGCGGHVLELRRTVVGHFTIQNAITLAQLETIDSPAQRQKFLLSTEQSLTHLPIINLPDNIAFYLCRGRSVRAPTTTEETPQSGLVRVYSDSTGFLGLAEIAEDQKVVPKRLF